MGTESAPKTATHIALDPFHAHCIWHQFLLSHKILTEKPKSREVFGAHECSRLPAEMSSQIEFFICFQFGWSFFTQKICDISSSGSGCSATLKELWAIFASSDARAEIFNVISLASMIQQLFYHFNGTRDFFPSEHNNFMLAFRAFWIPKNSASCLISRMKQRQKDKETARLAHSMLL